MVEIELSWGQHKELKDTVETYSNQQEFQELLDKLEDTPDSFGEKRQNFEIDIDENVLPVLKEKLEEQRNALDAYASGLPRDSQERVEYDSKIASLQSLLLKPAFKET